MKEKGHMLDDSPLTKEKIEQLKISAEEMLMELEPKDTKQEKLEIVPATA